MPTTEEPKKGYRKLLPANRCAFCKQKTDVVRECAECGESNFRTCKKCVAMGAPCIHAPRRMLRVMSEKKNFYVCYPQCARAAAYKCNQCHRWHDKSLLHAVTRQNGNVNGSLCEPCAYRNKITVCASCHRVCNQVKEFQDKMGFKCDTCFSRGNSFSSINKPFKIVKAKPDERRTFGLELEINTIHKKDDLAKEIAALNVDGVEFSVKGDGSVYRGFEIVSIAADRRTLSKATKEMCKIVRKYKHNYENSGLHVHVKDLDVNYAEIFKLWCAVELFVFSFLPRFRRRGSYGCAIVEHMNGHRISDIWNVRDKEDALRIQYDRYRSINYFAIAKYGTIEFRCHHATSDYRDIYHFMTCIDSVFRQSQVTRTAEEYQKLYTLSTMCFDSPQAFRDIASALHLPLPTAHYLEERRNFYVAHPEISDRELGVLPTYQIDNAEDRPLSVRLNEERRRMEERARREQEQMLTMYDRAVRGEPRRSIPQIIIDEALRNEGQPLRTSPMDVDIGDAQPVPEQALRRATQQVARWMQ